MKEIEFEKQIDQLCGKAYIAGGWVRDHFRGVEASDKDYVIAGVEEQAFRKAFPAALKIGNSFPVYLLMIEGKKSEVAFARKEKKVRPGYKGFSVCYGTDVSIEEDLYRRDTTMNSIAYCLRSKEFIDPYHGISDINNRCIRATSPYFLEDSVRALRAARQAAQTGFEIDADTLHLMEACHKELQAEPPERLVIELRKALKAPKPSIFFYILKNARLLRATYPQIFDLIGKSQPLEHHPEGDAFVHSMIVLDRVAEKTERAETRFSALVHDIGKGLTPPEELPHHYGHEKKGLDALMSFNQQMTLPKLWLSCAKLVITEHMRATTICKLGKIVDLLLRIEKNPLGFDGFNAIIMADHGSLPDFLAHFRLYLKTIHQVHSTAIPETLTGREIGQWIRQKQIQACGELLSGHKYEVPFIE